MSSYTRENVLLYDEIYGRMKNYAEEAEKIRSVIRASHPGAVSVLDVGCGTAEHARRLKRDLQIDGLDLSEEFLEIARAKNPDCDFHLGDMTDFHLPKRYDVVMSLFSAIGYVVTEEKLRRALRCFADHLNPGGLVIVEPWLTPDRWKPGKPFMFTIDEPDFKLCRMNTTETRGGASYFEWHFLVSKPEGTFHFTDEHHLGLFSVEQMKAAFADAGLEVEHDPEGIFGRGLYTGRVTADRD